MRRRDVISTIKKAADAAGVAFGLARQGARHEVWTLDGDALTIPRHREINEHTAHAIFRICETKLGEGWWRS